MAHTAAAGQDPHVAAWLVDLDPFAHGPDQPAAVLGAQAVPDLVEIGGALRDPFGLDLAIVQEA